MTFQISVAPMMGYTNRHARYCMRLLSPHIKLYTEMITSQAILFGKTRELLLFDPSENYLALQLGGNNPQELARCAQIGESLGFDEINLNVGCPSERVKNGQFGACLMLEPERVAECILAMQNQVNIPVSIKCRIGVDEHDSLDELKHFIMLNQQAGCRIFIIHARKAWLKGLNPKQNRTIPPLQYDVVNQIKESFKNLTIIINGGFSDLQQISAQENKVDGVMIGRAAQANPYLLQQLDTKFYGGKGLKRNEVIYAMIPYIERELSQQKTKFSILIKYLLNMFQGEPGVRKWRRFLSENAHKQNAGIDILIDALQFIEE